uniref:FAR1 DNA-binding domain n=2 Tax=Schistocephalus solidus TaxID=70667 RepID=A0A0X3PT92_SCHSO
MDLDDKFGRMFTVSSFSSFAELNASVKQFEQETGSVFRLRISHRYSHLDPEAERLVYKRFSYVCIHYGTYESRGRPQCKRRTLRSGCPAYFEVRGSAVGLRVIRYSMLHNHAVTVGAQNTYPSQRRLTASEKSIVKELIRAKTSNQALRDFIRDNFQKAYELSDIRQLRYRLTHPHAMGHYGVEPNLPEAGSTAICQAISLSEDVQRRNLGGSPTAFEQASLDQRKKLALKEVVLRLKTVFQRSDASALPGLLKSCDAWLTSIERQVSSCPQSLLQPKFICRRETPRWLSHGLTSRAPPLTPRVVLCDGEDSNSNGHFAELLTSEVDLGDFLRQVDDNDDDHDGSSSALSRPRSSSQQWKTECGGLGRAEESVAAGIAMRCRECGNHCPPSTSISASSAVWIACIHCNSCYHQLCVGSHSPATFFCRHCEAG